jgi:hypothetical protein
MYTSFHILFSVNQKNKAWQLIILSDEVNIHNLGNPPYKWHRVYWWSTHRRHRGNYKSHNHFLMKAKPSKTELVPACTVCIIFFSLWFHLTMLDTRTWNAICTCVFPSETQLIIWSPFFLAACFGCMRPSLGVFCHARIVALYVKIMYRVWTRYFLIKINQY